MYDVYIPPNLFSFCTEPETVQPQDRTFSESFPIILQISWRIFIRSFSLISTSYFSHFELFLCMTGLFHIPGIYRSFHRNKRDLLVMRPFLWSSSEQSSRFKNSLRYNLAVSQKDSKCFLAYFYKVNTLGSFFCNS